MNIVYYYWKKVVILLFLIFSISRLLGMSEEVEQLKNDLEKCQTSESKELISDLDIIFSNDLFNKNHQDSRDNRNKEKGYLRSIADKYDPREYMIDLFQRYRINPQTELKTTFSIVYDYKKYENVKSLSKDDLMRYSFESLREYFYLYAKEVLLGRPDFFIQKMQQLKKEAIKLNTFLSLNIARVIDEFIYFNTFETNKDFDKSAKAIENIIKLYSLFSINGKKGLKTYFTIFCDGAMYTHRNSLNIYQYSDIKYYSFTTLIMYFVFYMEEYKKECFNKLQKEDKEIIKLAESTIPRDKLLEGGALMLEIMKNQREEEQKAIDEEHLSYYRNAIRDIKEELQEFKKLEKSQDILIEEIKKETKL